MIDQHPFFMNKYLRRQLSLIMFIIHCCSSFTVAVYFYETILMRQRLPILVPRPRPIMVYMLMSSKGEQCSDWEM